jgi:CO/xanthine dehydrogenase Mo-binding subunit
MRADGSGVIRVAGADGVVEAIRAANPLLDIEPVSVAGPAVSSAIRAAGWAEAAVLRAAAGAVAEGRVPHAGSPSTAEAIIRAPNGAEASASVAVTGDGLPTAVEVTVSCGDSLDEVTLRSYAIGAAHMALGWVCSEGIAVGDDGVPEDLTIRSFGILRARDTPPITVAIRQGSAPTKPVRGSDAVFASVAAATWIAQGLPPRWPTLRGRMK